MENAFVTRKMIRNIACVIYSGVTETFSITVEPSITQTFASIMDGRMHYVIKEIIGRHTYQRTSLRVKSNVYKE